MSLSAEQADEIFRNAEMLHPAEEVERAIDEVATRITAALRNSHPLVLVVMGGAVVFAGRIIPRLRFPLEVDYLHVTRYGKSTAGGQLDWKVLPRENVKGRTVLVLDDILDEGHTLAAIRDKVLGLGAGAFHTAVLCEKDTGREKPIRADFCGLTLPDRYVFGMGMDVQGAWRNLPEIYAVGSPVS